jgi:hypothetical protein
VDWINLSINPEFVDMVIRTMNGEASVHDVETGFAGAATAGLGRLDNMRFVNEHFIAMICQSQLFQMMCANIIGQVGSRTDLDDKKAVFHLSSAQLILVGMHLHEQLLDKKAKGLLH